ncbi:DUF6624 domain-containing protein [Flammeovirga aprica]|uniref:Uncharacterized protein n=1 Tax=Flammeovirga aprica JL-4 TaxID=694437 RepID=A0A7X9RZK9_9BACT|nr:DUF6624 domain-containing protein [Flammeovirga aprica]NME71585.1 hypothetical protein [Flammeovirga aprica JL-4]
MKKIILLLFPLFINCTNTSTTEKQLTYEEITILLDSIHEVDQFSRKKIQKVFNEYGRESDEFINELKSLQTSDSLNTLVVCNILDQYGWLETSKIGSTANRTLFLVLQHADKDTRGKYLETIRQATLEGKASKSSLALYEDRLNLENGKPQVYGSQVSMDNENGENYVFPIQNPETVNESRIAVGLDSIETYLSYFNIQWNLEEYYKALPKRMAELEKDKM